LHLPRLERKHVKLSIVRLAAGNLPRFHFD
jgi:hypothetical protein